MYGLGGEDEARGQRVDRREKEICACFCSWGFFLEGKK